MQEFLKATAAARQLNDAVKAARAYGLILVVDLGELADTSEVNVFVAGQQDDKPARLRLVQ